MSSDVVALRLAFRLAGRPQDLCLTERKCAAIDGKLDTMDIGFIGLGNMGAGMAANLTHAGHSVTVYNRSPAKAEALVRQGAIRASAVGTDRR